MKPIQSRGFIIFLDVFFTDSLTAIKDIVINKIFKLDHQKTGAKKSNGESIQCIRQRVLEEAPKISEFFKTIFFILNIYAKEQIYLLNHQLN
mgnify:FL=1